MEMKVGLNKNSELRMFAILDVSNIWIHNTSFMTPSWIDRSSLLRVLCSHLYRSTTIAVARFDGMCDWKQWIATEYSEANHPKIAIGVYLDVDITTAEPYKMGYAPYNHSS